MKTLLKTLMAALGVGMLLASGSALAEQTIGVQAAGTPAIATAHVNVRVVVPKIVILRVGNADASVSDVTFSVTATGVAGTGTSLAYAGAIPPGFASTVATTNPTTALGVLTVGAWTNSNGTLLSCSYTTALAGATAFAVGATASGVPGTTDITVASGLAGTLQHPGASLTGCSGTSAITTSVAMVGTFTYGLSLTSAANWLAGTYGNTVIYTATTL